MQNPVSLPSPKDYFSYNGYFVKSRFDCNCFLLFRRWKTLESSWAFCDEIGVPKTDIFQTVDLYEAQNIPQVSYFQKTQR